MWLFSEPTAADMDNPEPGAVFVGRMEADHLGGSFKAGALVTMQVLEPDAPVSIGTLYILDDGSDVAVVRMLNRSPDLWVIDLYLDAGSVRRRALARRRWLPRASVTVQ